MYERVRECVCLRGVCRLSMWDWLLGGEAERHHCWLGAKCASNPAPTGSLRLTLSCSCQLSPGPGIGSPTGALLSPPCVYGATAWGPTLAPARERGVRCAAPLGEDRGGRQQIGRGLGSGAALRVLQGAKINPTRRIRFPDQNNPAAALEMRNGKMIPGSRQRWRR